ncbi:DinB family protein [Chitinophaga rhizosphaerae]|uniref:DinB family protein n=1 Tax=Chitinophaga rhizosphaerae TaxID=1864947 RepID=UPI000F7FF515|nr:DinB family protein [Chitinophaga rhizosphaerae]
MTTQSLISDFNQSTTELLDALGHFSQEQLNRVPFAGSWTPGQVGQHLLKSESGVPELLRGNTRVADRDPEALAPVLRSIFLDFTTKFEAMESITPDELPKDREQLMQALQSNRDEILQLIAASDPDLLILDFPFPQLGELTIREWLTFLSAHSRRHTHQLKKMVPFLD